MEPDDYIGDGSHGDAPGMGRRGTPPVGFAELRGLVAPGEPVRPGEAAPEAAGRDSTGEDATPHRHTARRPLFEDVRVGGESADDIAVGDEPSDDEEVADGRIASPEDSAGEASSADGAAPDESSPGESPLDDPSPPKSRLSASALSASAASAAKSSARRDTPRADEPGRDGAGGVWNETMDGLLELIRDELGRSDNRRLQEIEPGQWWLADREDRTGAALPLADRVEWAIFSLLSTAGRLSEAALFERIGHMFTGRDQPDERLIRACLDSYRNVASTAERLVTAEDIPRRSQEHVELVALLAELGHRLSMQVWIGVREQTRTLRGQRLAGWLDDRELRVNLTSVLRAPEGEVELVPCIWYVRSKAAFTFELEWTAMLGEPILRRHARIPPDERLVRFVVIAPERTELVRYKLARSPLLRQSMEAGNWHILKSNRLRTLAERDTVSLADLEPLLGLDPPVDRGAEQIPLFS